MRSEFGAQSRSYRLTLWFGSILARTTQRPGAPRISAAAGNHRRISRRAVIAGCVAFLGLPPASLAASHPTLTQLEAIHLVEQHVAPLAVSTVQPGEHEGRPGYVVEGSSAGDRIRAFVEAATTRALWVAKNGRPSYEWKGIVVVGHRGAVHQAPENTLASFERAIELGADLIEIDVRETKDGHLVIMHDETIDRTTNGTGRVDDLTLAEIRQLDAGAWFDPKFRGQKVPTLDEALEAMKGRALPDLDFRAGTSAKLMEAVKRHGLLGKATSTAATGI